MLLQPPPRPANDARLTRFTTLLDTITEGERTLDLAHVEVERSHPDQAEKELTQFILRARMVLEGCKDLPAEYVDLLGSILARCMVARAAAWVEQSFATEPAAHALRDAARADIAEVSELPVGWRDARTQMTVSRLQLVLNPLTM